MKTWLCIRVSDGGLAGTWGPSDQPHPPHNDEHWFVDAEAYPGFSPGARLNEVKVDEHGVVTGKMVPAPPVPDYGQLVDPREFLLLFTSGQRQAIRAETKKDAEVDDLVRMFELPAGLRLKSPFIINALQTLLAKKLIAKADVTRISNGLPPQG